MTELFREHYDNDTLRAIPVLTLAHIGDGVYELLARSAVVARGGQKVVDAGLYGIVRHPMYAVTLLLFLSMPLVLGSIISFIIFLVYPLLIAKRIKNEEQVLEAGLPGYKEYKQKVKYRMIPFIW